MKENNPFRIYVYLKGEGTDVWRPVQAVRTSENTYRIISENPSVEDEEWQFKSGDIVRCKEKVADDNDVYLVAYERVSD